MSKDIKTDETRTFGHGGNIHNLSRTTKEGSRQIVDFSANINPLGPPEWLRRVVSRELETIVHYPDPECYEFVQAISENFDIDASHILPANGTTELLYLLPRIINCERALIPMPSYIDYAKVMEMAGIKVEPFFLKPEFGFQLDVELLSTQLRENDIVIIGSPNNPTGTVVNSIKLFNLAKDFPGCIFVIDEAFLDFVDDATHLGGRLENIITLNSLTKFYAIPGLRLGYGVFPKKYAKKIRTLIPPWTVNTLAQAVGSRLFDDSEYANQSRQTSSVLRNGLVENLKKFSELKVFESQANYLLIQIKNGLSSREFASKMIQEGIAIRVCDNYQGLDESYFRIAVRREKENNILLEAMEKVLNFKTPKVSAKRDKKTPAIMFQGTASNAGKSVLTAALCRILLQDGVRVAPFKAQNMSLNSFVTHDGLEMGRAQVVQAQAARLDPDVRMNPVLLKPNSDVGSQIIVHGKPIGNMSAIEYYAYKEKVKKAAHSSYDDLSGEYDAIILEGAGSPGEVNLKKNDIVNMSMARYAESPVLLVGDIDRGGVYASFVGTMEVFYQWERDLIAGFVVNRFRGQASLLHDAHTYVKAHTGKEVFGVVPYVQQLGIPEEDSVSFKAGIFKRDTPEESFVDIVLVNLPHISNFTDVEPFLEEPDVHLRVVSSVDDLGTPDAIILPGSKNVIGDITALRSNGMDKAIVNLAEKGCEIVGICGGYQIIGKTIKDPYCIESDGDEVKGLGLLDFSTVLEKNKHLTRQMGTHERSKLPVHGYEIHHGVSQGSLKPLVRFEDGKHCGASHDELPIWGCYLHGIFDADDFRRWFIDELRQRKGFAPVKKVLVSYDLEPAFDRLANVVRESLDMKAVYTLLGL